MKTKLFGGEDLVLKYLHEDIWCLYIMQATRIINSGLNTHTQKKTVPKQLYKILRTINNHIFLKYDNIFS